PPGLRPRRPAAIRVLWRGGPLPPGPHLLAGSAGPSPSRHWGSVATRPRPRRTPPRGDRSPPRCVQPDRTRHRLHPDPDRPAGPHHRRPVPVRRVVVTRPWPTTAATGPLPPRPGRQPVRPPAAADPPAHAPSAPRSRRDSCRAGRDPPARSAPARPTVVADRPRPARPVRPRAAAAPDGVVRAHPDRPAATAAA